jgi:hypothetical protein
MDEQFVFVHSPAHENRGPENPYLYYAQKGRAGIIFQMSSAWA